MGTLGADVSHWQQSTPTAGLSFLFVKATEGSGHADPMYATHIGRAIAAGLLPGAYHFARNDADLDAQARWFVRHAVGARALAIDVEGPHSLTRTQTRTLLSLVRQYDALHRHVGLYMSDLAPFYTNVGADFNWVAHYGVPAPVTNWHIHQYTNQPYDRNRAVNQAVLNSIFQVKVQPAVPTVHIAQGATVRLYTLGTTYIDGQRCILTLPDGTYGKDVEWARASSHANIYLPPGEVHRDTCDGESGAWTVRVKDGAFAGRWIQTRANGVTVS